MKRTPLAARYLLLTAAAMLAGALASSAADADPGCTEQWGQQVIDDTGLAAPDGWTVRVYCEPGDQWAGLTTVDTRTIEIWAPRHRTADEIQWTYAHEVGHVYAVERLDEWARDGWIAERGIPAWDGAWFDGEWGEWLPGSEDWAESVAYCVTGLDDHRMPGWTPPTTAQCGLVQYLTGLPSAV